MTDAIFAICIAQKLDCLYEHYWGRTQVKLGRKRPQKKCPICTRKADKIFNRVEVWSNERWRLTTTRYSQVKGLSYLEPKKHVPFLSDLDGKEAKEFGVILSNVTKAIKIATGAQLVYYYVFGDTIPHLHVHIAPHFPGDVLSENITKETFDEGTLSTMKPEKVSKLVRRLQELLR